MVGQSTSGSADTGKEAVSDDADQQHRDHQQGRADWAENENPRRVHRELLRVLRRGLVHPCRPALRGRLAGHGARYSAAGLAERQGRHSRFLLCRLHLGRSGPSKPVTEAGRSPSITTVSPGFSPVDLDPIAVGDARLDFLNADRIVWLTQKNKVPGAPRLIAATGAIVALSSVRTNSRALTN